MTDEPKNHGGKRPGAGRKPTGAALRTIRLTDAHYDLIRTIKKLTVPQQQLVIEFVESLQKGAP